MELEFQRPTSWLFTDERYAHIRRLALTDKIALITESICAVETFASIAKLTKKELTPLSSQNWFFNSALKAEDNEPHYTTAALAS